MFSSICVLNQKINKYSSASSPTYKNTTIQIRGLPERLLRNGVIRQASFVAISLRPGWVGVYERKTKCQYYYQYRNCEIILYP